MVPSSNENIFRVTGPLCGGFAGDRWIPLHKSKWRRALMFPFDLHLNKGLSNRPAGDLRHYRAHYDVNVMHGVCRNLVEYGKDRIKIKLVWVEWRQIIFVYPHLCGNRVFLFNQLHILCHSMIKWIVEKGSNWQTIECNIAGVFLHFVVRCSTKTCN